MLQARLARQIACVLVCLIDGASDMSAAQAGPREHDRRALIAALESLIATGEPRHTTHDEGERLQLAVDEAIARGDHEIEQLAIRAAAPLTAYISRPVNSTLDLPSVVFSASNVLRVRRSVPYTAQVHASVADIRETESSGIESVTARPPRQLRTMDAPSP